MKHLKHFESKLYQYQEPSYQVKNCVDISKKALRVLDEFKIKYVINKTQGYSDKSLNGKEFEFAYLKNYQYIMEMDDDWFFARVGGLDGKTEIYLIDGYDGLKEFIRDKMI